MAGNTAEALRRIQENEQTKSKILDLSGLGLTELPDELWDCVWVEELGLGKRYWSIDTESWSYAHDRGSNYFFQLPFAIANLQQLKVLLLDETNISSLLTLSTLRKLQTLKLDGCQIQSLDGLKDLPKLEILSINGGKVLNLTVLSRLFSLRTLTLAGSHIGDLSPISGLPHLESLDLSGSNISELNGVKNLPSLQDIDLSDTQLSSLYDLNPFPSLQGIILSETLIENLDGINQFPNLKELNLENSKLRNTNGISRLKKLEWLKLDNTPITSLQGLNDLPNLTHLFLQGVKIKNLYGLARLPNLELLDFTNSTIADLSGLQTFTNLERIELTRTKVSNLSDLSGLTKISSLDLRETSVKQLIGLTNLPNLESLNLDKTELSSLQGLNNLTRIKALSLRETPLTTLVGLSDLPNLETVDLFKTPIQSLEGMNNLPNLSHLILRESTISDLQGIEKFPKLKNLFLDKTPIQKLDSLKNHPSLTKLNLSSSQVNDLKGLSGLPKLKTLNLERTQVSQLADLDHLPELTTLDLNGTKISFEGIKALPKLVTLNLKGCDIQSLKGIGTLSELKEINLNNAKAVSLGALNGLLKLKTLALSRCLINNLDGLFDLPALEKLDLSSTKIDNLSGISNFKSLKLLNLTGCQLQNLQDLGGLSQLQELNLERSKLKELLGIEQLGTLRTLNLSEVQVSDWSLLAQLTELHTLILTESSIKDLSCLSELKNLEILNVKSTKIKELEGINTLTKLRDLNLNGSKVRGLSALKDLINLEILDLGLTPIKDIDDVAKLTRLTNLDLNETAVSDLSSLLHLSNLESLNIERTKVHDLEILCDLENLECLNLASTPITYFPFSLLLSPKLSELHLGGTKSINLPEELIAGSSTLPDLRNYYFDLQRDAYSAYEAKLIIVGNGRVGKTSLMKTLYGQGDFDPNEDSTHGIQLFDATLPLPDKGVSAQLSIWDFGGQELYHATHRIFMQVRALFLVVWDPANEANPGEETVQLDGLELKFRNFPLSYWLGNVQALSPSAKIIVVCNKADDGLEHFPDQIKALHDSYGVDYFVSVSAKTGYGVTTLRHQIQYLLGQMPEMGIRMPSSWRNIQEKLKDIRKVKQHISFDEYQLVCSSEILAEESASTVLRYLHHSGFLYWHEEYLADQIILDQKWALEAIYQLLDRNGWFTLLKGNALRTKNELAKCWREYSPEQVLIFLELMQSCDLCLRLEWESNNPAYLIPEFLPDVQSPAVNDIWKAQTSLIYHFRFEHSFLSISSLQSFLIQNAKLSERYDLLWRTGLLLRVEDTYALVQLYPERGLIEVKLRGDQPGELLERLVNELAWNQGVDRDEPCFLVSCSGYYGEWVVLSQLNKQRSKGKLHLASTTGEILEIAPFLPLFGYAEQEWDQGASDLKELADRETGSQLLQPTEPRNQLEALQNEVKAQLIAADIPGAFTLLRNYLKPGTISADDLLLLQSQYARYQEELLFDVLSSEERRLNYNRLVKGVLELVNRL